MVIMCHHLRLAYPIACMDAFLRDRPPLYNWSVPCVNIYSQPRQREFVDLIAEELPRVDVRIVADISSTIQVCTPQTHTFSLRFAKLRSDRITQEDHI